MAESVAEFFLDNFRAHAQGCAYRQRRGYRTESFTYGEVLDLAARFADEFDVRKIIKGDRVMLWGPNCAEWVAAFIGCVLRGVVVVPMDDAASPDFATRVAQQVDAKLLVASRAHAEEGTHFAVPIMGLEDLAEGFSGRPATALPQSSSPKRTDILQIVFTSGTTADPKGVVITHGNVLANIAPFEEQIRGYLKYERLVHP